MTNWIISESVNESFIKLSKASRLLKSTNKIVKMETTSQSIAENISHLVSSSVNKSIKNPQSASPWIDSGT